MEIIMMILRDFGILHFSTFLQKLMKKVTPIVVPAEIGLGTLYWQVDKERKSSKMNLFTVTEESWTKLFQILCC